MSDANLIASFHRRLEEDGPKEFQTYLKNLGLAPEELLAIAQRECAMVIQLSTFLEMHMLDLPLDDSSANAARAALLKAQGK
jgi:hypothetical protein